MIYRYRRSPTAADWLAYVWAGQNRQQPSRQRLYARSKWWQYLPFTCWPPCQLCSVYDSNLVIVGEQHVHRVKLINLRNTLSRGDYRRPVWIWSRVPRFLSQSRTSATADTNGSHASQCTVIDIVPRLPGEEQDLFFSFLDRHEKCID